jgi:hypothetical protein
MAEVRQSAAVAPLKEFLNLVLGIFTVGILVAIAYFFIGFLHRTESLKSYSRIISVVQYGVLVVFVLFAVVGFLSGVITLRNAVQAKKANEKVAQALNQIKDQSPDKNVVEISTQNLAVSLKDTKVGDEQLVRLVEQGKQQLLIDDEYFREELSSLIVDYLQPLPRNAKRLLNRFRVNLLIAHSRGLLSSPPKVSAQQIGKWLVLMERWPQLGRSLSAAPDKMKILEQQSEIRITTNSVTSQPDPFMESIKILASPYFGDEDLRTFIKSAPVLSAILSRLVYYGPAEVATLSEAK